VSVDPQGWAGIAETAPATAEPVHVQLERGETERAVRRLLAELPAEQRQVLELAYFWGLSQQQIASRLEVPVGTVKGRLRLGIAKLRRAWDDGSVAVAPGLRAA
jgi:RNA polymerase sigma-70 factor (ECF subfamily)